MYSVCFCHILEMLWVYSKYWPAHSSMVQFDRYNQLFHLSLILRGEHLNWKLKKKCMTLFVLIQLMLFLSWILMEICSIPWIPAWNIRYHCNPKKVLVLAFKKPQLLNANLHRLARGPGAWSWKALLGPIPRLRAMLSLISSHSMPLPWGRGCTSRASQGQDKPPCAWNHNPPTRPGPLGNSSQSTNTGVR